MILFTVESLKAVTVWDTILKGPLKEVGTDCRKGENLRDISYLGWLVFRLYELLLQGPHPDSGRPLVISSYSVLLWAFVFVSMIK